MPSTRHRSPCFTHELTILTSMSNLAARALRFSGVRPLLSSVATSTMPWALRRACCTLLIPTIRISDEDGILSPDDLSANDCSACTVTSGANRMASSLWLGRYSFSRSTSSMVSRWLGDLNFLENRFSRSPVVNGLLPLAAYHNLILFSRALNVASCCS